MEQPLTSSTDLYGTFSVSDDSEIPACLSPFWVFAVYHEPAAVGQLVDGLGVVLQSLLQNLVLLHHDQSTLFILQQP